MIFFILLGNYPDLVIYSTPDGVGGWEEEDESYYSRGFRAETPGFGYGTPLGVLSVHTNENRRVKKMC